MRIDLLFIQLAVVFLPRLIWTQLVATYAMKERPGPTEFLVRAFIFGFLTYVAVYFAYGWFGKEFSPLPVGDSERFLNVNFADELLWSSAAALTFSFVWMYGSTRRWMTRFLNRVGAATTHGKEDVWDLTFNRCRPQVEYVHVRDLERGITYCGWVRAYSRNRETEGVAAQGRDHLGQERQRPWRSVAVSRADGHRRAHRVSLPGRTTRNRRGRRRR